MDNMSNSSRECHIQIDSHKRVREFRAVDVAARCCVNSLLRTKSEFRHDAALLAGGVDFEFVIG